MMDNTYLVIKALHIISFTSWMAGMFYLPRIFVYHSEKKINNETYNKFLIMERKLIKIIMTPSLILTWLFGIIMIIQNTYILSELWLQIKILLVLIMSATHGLYVICYKKFLHGNNYFDHKFYRLANEIPTVLLIAIVFLVVLGPTF